MILNCISFFLYKEFHFTNSSIINGEFKIKYNTYNTDFAEIKKNCKKEKHFKLVLGYMPKKRST